MTRIRLIAVLGTEPRTPVRARSISDKRASIGYKQDEISSLERTIDVSLAQGLRVPVDRRMVRANAYTCRGAYPPASLIPEAVAGLSR